MWPDREGSACLHHRNPGITALHRAKLFIGITDLNIEHLQWRLKALGASVP